MPRVAAFLAFALLLGTPPVAIAQSDCAGTLGCPCGGPQLDQCTESDQLYCDDEPTSETFGLCLARQGLSCPPGALNCPCDTGTLPCADEGTFCDTAIDPNGTCRLERCRDCLSASDLGSSPQCSNQPQIDACRNGCSADCELPCRASECTACRSKCEMVAQECPSRCYANCPGDCFGVPVCIEICRSECDDHCDQAESACIASCNGPYCELGGLCQLCLGSCESSCPECAPPPEEICLNQSEIDGCRDGCSTGCGSVCVFAGLCTTCVSECTSFLRDCGNACRDACFDECGDDPLCLLVCRDACDLACNQRAAICLDGCYTPCSVGSLCQPCLSNCQSSCPGCIHPPEAICTDVTTCAEADSCTADANVDGGSFHPDGEPITLDQNPPPPYPIGATQVSLTAIDASGASDSCDAVVTVHDCTDPTITCPPAIVAECDGNGAASVSPGNPTVVDCSDYGVVRPAPHDYPLGTTEVQYTATDTSGNSAICTTTVTVEDSLPPEMTCPPDATLECDGSDGSSLPENTGMATAGDICDSAPGVSRSDSVTMGECSPESVILRRWTGMDGTGNTNSCDQTINVADTTAPVIACNNPATIMASDPPISFTATATDNCCGNDVFVEVTGLRCYQTTPNGRRIEITGSCPVELDGATATILQARGVGYEILWNAVAVDCCGNQSELPCGTMVVNLRASHGR